jgi:hypothetical protein
LAIWTVSEPAASTAEDGSAGAASAAVAEVNNFGAESMVPLGTVARMEIAYCVSDTRPVRLMGTTAALLAGLATMGLVTGRPSTSTV